MRKVAVYLLISLAVLTCMGLLAGCASPMPAPLDASPPDVTLAPTATPAPANPPAATSRADGLTEAEAATLASLEQVDGYPLYTMRFVGPTEPRAMGEAAPLVSQGDLSLPAWGCSLFAALADRENSLYGRNFDWEYSPALLLFTDPPDGYASVSLVDIAYLGFAGAKAGKIVDLPLAERRGLLNAPAIPFDGLNERGLAVGMAAVPPGNVPDDPEKETIGSLGVIRKILDWAQNVDEAVQILASYNIDFGGGPPIHYLIADRSGRAVLVEFYQGEIQVLPNDQPWHQATNFLRSAVGDSTAGQCWRYDKIGEALGGAGGRLDVAGAVGLLESVAQDNTQWSVVYGIASGEVHVVVGQKYEEVHSFKLVPGSD